MFLAAPQRGDALIRGLRARGADCITDSHVSGVLILTQNHITPRAQRKLSAAAGAGRRGEGERGACPRELAAGGAVLVLCSFLTSVDGLAGAEGKLASPSHRGRRGRRPGGAAPRERAGSAAAGHSSLSCTHMGLGFHEAK